MGAMASQITGASIVYSMRRSKKASKLRVPGLCEGHSPVTDEFPAQRASNAEDVSISWRHHEISPPCLQTMISFLDAIASASCSKIHVRVYFCRVYYQMRPHKTSTSIIHT